MSNWLQQLNLTDILYIAGILIIIGLILTILLLAWIVLRIRRINLPPDADPVTALLATPFVVVLVLDLLDFSLDFLSAPFSWTILSYLGLKPLRGVTVIESLIPGTQLIPTMTLAWIFVRIFNPSGK